MEKTTGYARSDFQNQTRPLTYHAKNRLFRDHVTFINLIKPKWRVNCRMYAQCYKEIETVVGLSVSFTTVNLARQLAAVFDHLTFNKLRKPKYSETGSKLATREVKKKHY